MIEHAVSVECAASVQPQRSQYAQYEDVISSLSSHLSTSSIENMNDNSFDAFRDIENLSLTNSDVTEHEDTSFLLERDSHNEELFQGNINTKIARWALYNITSLTHKCLDELLLILRNEGHLSLPKSSKTLLDTIKAKSNIRSILSHSGKYGLFNYFNIKSSLQKIISPDIYTAEDILLMINIDGASIHQSSKKYIWTILGLIYHQEYDARPFLIGLYYGKSKPNSVNEFLHDFIDEVNDLITNGINIGNSHYNFNIKAFTCDTPARAYIKC